MKIEIIKPCGCGAPAEVTERADGVDHNRWSVKCSRIVSMANKQRRPRSACHDSEPIYASRRDLAIGRWNGQFMTEIPDEDDGTPRCRCGLRVAKAGDSCGDCIKPVWFYARSGQSTYGAEQPRRMR